MILVVPPLLAAPHAVAANSWNFQLEFIAGYDDDITGLSDTDRDRVGQRANADRFRIETPDDFIESRAGWPKRSRGSSTHRETSCRIAAAADRRTRDFAKNYDVHGVRFSQDLVPSRRFGTTLSLRAGLTPNYDLRELSVPEASRLAGNDLDDSSIRPITR